MPLLEAEFIADGYVVLHFIQLLLCITLKLHVISYPFGTFPHLDSNSILQSMIG